MRTYKSLVWATVLLLPAYAEVIDQFTPHSFDNTTDVDLGVFDNVQDFFALMGTNQSAWVELDAPKAETLDLDLDADTFSPNPANSLLERQTDVCLERTGWEYIICENMPNSNVKYTMGILVALYYAPRLIDRWLLDIAILIRNGRTGWSQVQSATIQSRNLAARAEELFGDVKQVYFRVPVASPSALESRQVDEDGIEVETSFYDEFSLDTTTEQIYYRGVMASFSADDTNASPQKRELHERQQYLPIYNILVRHHVATRTLTTATPYCISQVLRYYVDRTRITRQFSCQPMHNRGTFMSNIGVQIMPGYINEFPFPCC